MGSIVGTTLAIVSAMFECDRVISGASTSFVPNARSLECETFEQARLRTTTTSPKIINKAPTVITHPRAMGRLLPLLELLSDDVCSTTALADVSVGKEPE